MNEQERLEDESVVHALGKVGISVSSTQDLMDTRCPYPAAVPVLIDMLGKVDTYMVKEMIVRSLGTKAAKGKAEKALIGAFDSSLHDDCVEARAYRWAIANTLDLIGGKGDVDAFVRLLQDPRSSNARGLLGVAAAKTKDKKVIPVLLEYLDSEKLQGFAARGLGILRASEAAPRLRAIAAETKNSWVRREATKAVSRIEASEGGIPAGPRRRRG
jgi:HEAT repeat protein